MASPSGSGRDDRFHPEPPKAFEFRTQGQRDRDRILYSSAFRRLGGVTQVVSANEESHLLHNRLTHSIKVAQIGRRLAERLARDYPAKFIAGVGGIDADVVEAACLAHDLGHPPFGHVGEQALDEAAKRYVADGFEGNAQSFRIITKISLRSTQYFGLNLSHATLDAVLKYPWFRSKKHSTKWSAYRTEAAEFNFARAGWAQGDERKSLEAEIMDWADDIAYSVHDVEDFYRMGLIPLDKLARDRKVDEERREFFDRVRARHIEKKINVGNFTQLQLERAASKAFNLMPEAEYEVSVDSRRALRSFTSNMIAQYVAALSLRSPKNSTGAFVKVAAQAKKEVTMLKELTWNYVIHNPSLATQQVGFRHIVETLFKRLFSAAAAKKNDLNLFPPLYRRDLELKLKQHAGKGKEKVRNAAVTRTILDVISSMTERQALRMYGRLEGTDPGSILDPLYY